MAIRLGHLKRERNKADASSSVASTTRASGISFVNSLTFDHFEVRSQLDQQLTLLLVTSVSLHSVKINATWYRIVRDIHVAS